MRAPLARLTALVVAAAATVGTTVATAPPAHAYCWTPCDPTAVNGRPFEGWFWETPGIVYRPVMDAADAGRRTGTEAAEEVRAARLQRCDRIHDLWISPIYGTSVDPVECARRTVDEQPPDAPTGLRAVVEGRTVTLSWNRSTADDVAKYRVESRSGVTEEIPTYYYNHTQVRLVQPAHTRDTYTVVAIDRAGHVSRPSASVTVAVGGDQ